MKNKKIIESKISMFFDVLITAAGMLGAFIARFWLESCDCFLICSLIACFSFHNLADSHEQYNNLLNEGNKDN